MDWSDIRLTLALLAPAVGFAIWFVKRVIDDRRQERRRQTAQDNLVRALYAEIDFNTRDMEIFREKSPPQSAIRVALEANVDLVPHITDARHTEIYRTRIGEVHTISDGALHQTVDFYGLLEKIRVQIEGINYPSYKTLSVEGRLNAVDVIRRTAFDAELCGKALLRLYAADYPALALKRYERPGDLSLEKIKARQAALDAGLARIRKTTP